MLLAPMSTKIHVAIIPDGNRRWAKAKTLLPWKGHESAMDNVRTLIEAAAKRDDVSVLTLWCFSTDNWKRSPEEIDKLMELLKNFLEKERASLTENDIRLVHSGRRDRVPADIIALIDEITEETKHHTGLTFHMALDYSGKDEMLRALKKMKDTSNVTDEAVQAHLDHPELPQMDLIIRTSGEQRTSNFFLWQAAYAEWMFVKKHFPDFGKDDLAAAIDDFSKRTRRFGA